MTSTAAVDAAAGTNNEDPSPATTTDSAAAAANSATTTMTTNSATPTPPANTTMFPCLEQPIRVTLHCNGYYLWGLRNGKVIARKRRSEKDEFRLNYSEGGSVVTIYNHKFGGILSVLEEDDTKTGTKKVSLVCVKPKKKSKDQQKQVQQEEQSSLETTKKDEEEQEKTAPTTTTTTSTTQEQFKDEDDVAEEEKEPNVDDSNITEEDQQWCFIRGTHGQNQVLLKSLKTGTNLAITGKGQIVFCNDDVIMDQSSSGGASSQRRSSSTNTNNAATDAADALHVTWDVECSTGELCFLSNPTLNCRLRCDMAGLITLTDAWKGWEVFRFMEASHGYVKISSWMHSQWLLCSKKDGSVTTCLMAESFAMDHDENSKLCSKWAIEKAPAQLPGSNDMSPHDGVILRSKSFNTLLCIKNGELKMYNPNNEETDSNNDEVNIAPLSLDNNNNDNSEKASGKGAGGRWKSMRSSFTSMSQQLTSKAASLRNSTSTFASAIKTVTPAETTIWQLEAAHSQTYYFASSPVLVEDADGKTSMSQPPKSIGPFPYVTPNLRKTDKIQFQKGESLEADELATKNDNTNDDTTASTTTTIKLYNIDQKQYIACSSTGTIVLVPQRDDPSTDWTMEKPQFQHGGSVFRNKLHNMYLSYEEESVTSGEATAESSSSNSGGGGHGHHFANLFGDSNQNMPKLIGSEFMGEREVWRLEPCMPRAVSSEKIATFAIGTGIAVGTTIAMPFALAGVGAVMGALGAEVGIVANVIFAGLTGAEALASVGAIGATAYLVFRPEDNSLTDDHKKEEEEEAERAWSKRPFSNWRNW